MNDSDIRYLLYSFIFHLSLVLIFTVKIFVFPSYRPEVLRSVRVDFVALPDLHPVEAPVGVEKEQKEVKAAKEEEKKPVAVEEKKETKKETSKKEKPTKEKDDVGLKKKVEETATKDQQSSSLKRLQALANLKKKKAEKKDGPEGTTYKGNQISAGSSLHGVEKLQHDQYMENLDLHIKKNWQLPEWLANKALTAAYLVKFDENGVILEKRFIRASGNETFDREVIQTVEASAPFPAPPEALISYFKVKGIELRFPE